MFYCLSIGTRFLAYTATVDEVPISVISHGIGGPSVATVLQELGHPRILVRFGSCSVLKKEPLPGESAICTAACCYDGTSDIWLPLGFPAAADSLVTQALIASAAALRQKYHVGVGVTTADFYGGQGRPDADGHLDPVLQARHEKVIQLGALCYDMEAATVLAWAQAKKVPAGVILAIYGNRITNELEIQGDEMTFQVALSAILSLHRQFFDKPMTG